MGWTSRRASAAKWVLRTRYFVRGAATATSRSRTLSFFPPLRLSSIAILFLAGCVFALPARGQFFERSLALPPAEIEQLDATSAAHLENAKRFLAEEQWAEAVEAIRRVQEGEPGRLVKVGLAQPLAGFERYIPAGEYCQWRLAALAAEAPEALAHYRQLVDPLAEAWLREGSEKNDESQLLRVAEQAFASRAGDDALLRLGDLALARGEPAVARARYERISPLLTVPPAAAPALKASVGSPLWLPLARIDFAAQGAALAALFEPPQAAPAGVYPDTDLDLATVRARLVLASLLEGSRERAEVELALLRLLHPAAEGELAGRRGRYADLLQSLFDESAAWQPPEVSPDWTTFAGNRARGKIASRGSDLAGGPLWTYSLPKLDSDRESIGEGRLRVAEDGKSLLGYHPAVVGKEVFVRADARGSSYLIALDLFTGRELWKIDYSRGMVADAAAEAPSDKPFEVSDAHSDLPRHVGVARYTASAHDGKTFARMGSPVTVPSARRAALWLDSDQGFLLGVDRATEGKPLEGFPLRPPGREWTFEGTPLVEGGVLYTAMRRVEGSRSQIYLAAYALQTTPAALPDEDDAPPAGRLVWRTRLCSAASLGGGEVDQLTHLLVTLDGGHVHLNTNAGVVAAVSADDGRLLWLVKYPRAAYRGASLDQPDQHWFRDLTPCLAYKDRVIVAPADCERIFALEAASGELRWALPPGAAADAVHLLGAESDVVIASGDRLYWIDANTGRILTQFPGGTSGGPGQAAPSPRGLGRGVLADGQVWWPTRESLFVFDVEPAKTDFGLQPRLIREIPLAPRGVTGGNLVIAGGVLLIATGDRLVAFGE